MFSNCTSTNCFHVNVQNIINTFRPKIFPFSTLLNNQLILLLSNVGFLGNDGPFLSLQVTYSFWLDRLLVTSQPRVAITGEGKRTSVFGDLEFEFVVDTVFLVKS
jgi:hypothetical protein